MSTARPISISLLESKSDMISLLTATEIRRLTGFEIIMTYNGDWREAARRRRYIGDIRKYKVTMNQ